MITKYGAKPDQTAKTAEGRPGTYQEAPKTPKPKDTPREQLPVRDQQSR